MNQTVSVDLTGNKKLDDELEGIGEAFAEAYDEFDDEFYEEEDDSQAVRENNAMNFLGGLRDYFRSEFFKADVDSASKKWHMPKKQVAQNFFDKALGTLGDILGIGISVVRNGAHVIVNLAASIAHGIIDLVCNIATGIASIVTFNKTCIA